MDGPTRILSDSSLACHIMTKHASEAHIPSATTMRYQSSDTMPRVMMGERRKELVGAGKAAKQVCEEQIEVGMALAVVGSCWTSFQVQAAALNNTE